MVTSGSWPASCDPESPFGPSLFWGVAGWVWHNDGVAMGSPQDPEPELALQRSLLRRAQAGDRAALGQLYRAFAPRLYRSVLMPRLGNAQAAEDALSETFRTLIEHLHNVDAESRSLYVWLARVARNKATDQHRARQRGGRALASFEPMLKPLRADADLGPEAEMEQRDNRLLLAHHVERVMDELNPRYRRALTLRFIEDRTRAECAAAMEVRLGTFDVLLLRAVRAFHRTWEVKVGSAGEEVS